MQSWVHEFGVSPTRAARRTGLESSSSQVVKSFAHRRRSLPVPAGRPNPAFDRPRRVGFQRPIGSQAIRSLGLGLGRKSSHGITRPSLANFVHPALVVQNNGTNVTACEKSSVVCLLSKFPEFREVEELCKVLLYSKKMTARLIFDHRPIPKAGLLASPRSLTTTGSIASRRHLSPYFTGGWVRP